MTICERCFRLALQVYPVAFRRTHGEEMLTTLLEMREASGGRGTPRDLASVLWGGGRQRWFAATGGSLAATLQQGVAWAVLMLITRQAGLAAQDVFVPLVRWGHIAGLGVGASVLVPLLVGWVATFCLLASDRRVWGLAALTATLIGFTYYRTHMALGYPGRLDLPWTLGFFLPTVLPLVAAYAWPRAGIKLRARWWALWLVPAAVVSPLSALGWTWGPYWFAQIPVVWLLIVAGAILLGLAALITGLCDPRWLAAATLLLMAWGAKHALPVISGRNLFLDAIVPLAAAWVVIPVVCLLTVRRVSRRTLHTR